MVARNSQKPSPWQTRRPREVTILARSLFLGTDLLTPPQCNCCLQCGHCRSGFLPFVFKVLVFNQPFSCVFQFLLFKEWVPAWVFNDDGFNG